MRSIRAIHASRVASRNITSGDANGERRKKRKAESKERGTNRIYERNIDIEKRKRNDDSYYNRIIYVPRNNTGNLPFSIRYFRVSLRLLKNFSPAE